jgi:uncharacterized protein YdbL (DUF1318 family)
MKTMFRKTPIRPLLLAAALALSAAPAFADIAASKAAVDAAKAQGVVGEQADGFLGIVKGGDAAIRAAVAEINAGRASAYSDTAAKTGVSAAAAGQATARQLIARLPAGQFYKNESGAWAQK